MKRNGFTLIEMIVVVTSAALIMTGVVGISLNAVKSQNRSKSMTRVSESGSWILTELRRVVFNSRGNKINCLSTTSIRVVSLDDGKTSTISCGSNKIASASAESKDLNGSDINVISCMNFVSCTTLPSTEVSKVTFSFGLGTTTAGIGWTGYYSTSVTVRN